MYIIIHIQQTDNRTLFLTLGGSITICSRSVSSLTTGCKVEYSDNDLLLGTCGSNNCNSTLQYHTFVVATYKDILYAMLCVIMLCLFACMYVCMYVCVHVCVCVRACMYVCMCVFVHVFVCTCV